MRTISLALFIAALTIPGPALAGGRYHSPMYGLKSFLRQLAVPQRPVPRRKKAASRPATDQPVSGEKGAAPAVPTRERNTATPETAPEATATRLKGKRAKQKSTATAPVAADKPKEAPPTPVKASSAAVATTSLDAITEGPAKTRPKAVVTALRPADLVEFDRQPKRIREIISAALAMTEMDLYYAYGSNNPRNGGMDCSGTIQYLLKSQGFRDAPRQADLIYAWSKQRGALIPANVHRTDAPELKELRPGDLLFWSGTYKINRSVSHVMLYLGTEKRTNLPVMFGASSGRTYQGESRHGVSVFDFKLPRPKGKARFEGYGPIPGMFTTAEDARSPRS
ncbi:MAG: C40 family peptidase [Gammaproteobacteria bacterium]|nr:C40 family peptidase [Gammaproteobacteria bacterium]MBU1653463.1 C40 family peptidase [Gammaproteobacteria bacterium]MBU1960820.1 C40 family peptidase [Gammaproteobacteria bacterium]